MNKINKKFQTKKLEIQQRLAQFKSLKENEMFKEHLFCLLTPQSKAQSCWQAIEELSKIPEKEWTLEDITNILKSKTRFHNTKAKRILNASLTYKQIISQINNPPLSTIELRNNISRIVNGYGLKEASHFLRNIGKSNNEIAILDRHILRNLKQLKIIKDEKIKSNKDYLEKEQSYLNFAKSINIPADELDLFFWQKENGEIFK